MKYLFFALLTVLVLVNAASARAEPAEAEVLSISGEVNARKAGQTGWSAVSEGTLLSEGDTISTGKGASAELSMAEEDNIVASLSGDTTAILRGKTLERVELSIGSIRSLVKKLGKGSSFEVKTPTVIAGARGSGWDVGYDGESTTVKAFEDSISVKSIDEKGKVLREVSLDQDFQISVDRQLKFGDRKLIRAADKDKWKKWKGMKRPPRKNIKGKMIKGHVLRLRSGQGSGDMKNSQGNPSPEGTKNRRR